MEISQSEKQRYELAQSILRMEGEAAWKGMVGALTALEAEQIERLESYLDTSEHPDREEVISLCLMWRGVRKVRKLLLQNVEEAKDFKRDLGKNLLVEFSKDPTQPVPDDLRGILLENL